MASLTLLADTPTPLLPIESYPGWKEEAEKYSRIRVGATGIEQELREVNSDIASQFRGRDEIEQAKAGAEALLEGKDLDFGPKLSSLMERRDQLRRKLAAFGIARAIQKGKIDDIKAAASVHAAEIMESEHKAAVLGVAVALANLREAVATEQRVRRALPDAGYDDRLPNFDPGLDFRPCCALSDHERRAREYAR